jgi:hypothetical protein
MQIQSTFLLFIDEESTPIGEYKTPINFELDTTKICDGNHVLTSVRKSHLTKEGSRKIPFTVRTGRSISFEGTNIDLVLYCQFSDTTQKKSY